MSLVDKMVGQIKITKKRDDDKATEQWAFQHGKASFSIAVGPDASEPELRTRAARFFRHLVKNPKAKYVPLAAVLTEEASKKEEKKEN